MVNEAEPVWLESLYSTIGQADLTRTRVLRSLFSSTSHWVLEGSETDADIAPPEGPTSCSVVGASCRSGISILGGSAGADRHRRPMPMALPATIARMRDMAFSW